MSAVAQRVARLPVPGVPSAGGVRIWSRVHGAEGGRLCGDVVVAEALPGGRVALVVGDVLGHGWSQAVLAGFLADRVVSMLALGCTPGLALLTADEEFRSAIAADSSFAAMFVAVLDPRRGVLRYSSAGHDAARILHPDGSSRRLEANGPLLGVLAQPEFGEGQLALEPGRHLVVVTDGIVESRPPGTLEFFGVERALCSVADAVLAQADPAAALVADVLRHAGGVPADDAAALVVAW